VDLVLRREDRPRAVRLILDRLRERFPMLMEDGCSEREAEAALPDFGDRSRAFLRVQEGCDLVCSYCVIPAVRGPSRSVPPEQVARRFGHLLEAGFREIVLTGVNTGDYGRDLAPQLTLVSLIERLLRLEGDFRIRLNSVEPRRVTSDLIGLLAHEPKLASHLQVPLQSGSDAVLRAMRRNYRVADYRAAVESLRSRVPGIGVGADVITGFPTEGVEQFDETRRTLQACGVAFLHVFTYSPRPGTAAAGLGPGPGHAEVKRRTAALRELGRGLTESFARSQVGRTSRALVLAGRRDDGRARALMSSFLEVALEGEALANTWRDVTIAGVTGGVAHAV
jgi:threonylcarbamoyladenosine tRNA methylthiotransferase MtaB